MPGPTANPLDEALERDGYATVRNVTRQHRGTSFWLSAALADLDRRDPVDALNDAETLAKIQRQRWAEMSEATG